MFVVPAVHAAAEISMLLVCCGWATGLATQLTSAWWAQPRQNQMTAPREGCLRMCCVSAGLNSWPFPSFSCQRKDAGLSQPAWLSLSSWKLSSKTQTMNRRRVGSSQRQNTSQTERNSCNILSSEMQKAPVFPDAVFKKWGTKNFPMTPTNIKHQKTNKWEHKTVHTRERRPF